jgi:hypothetical protein
MSFAGIVLGVLGGSKVRTKVNSPNLLAADTANDPANANASIVWFSSGSIERNNLFDSTWLVFGQGSDYELFVTGTGDTPGGTGNLDTWQNMGLDLGYALAQTSPGEQSFSGTYQIRLVSGHGLVGSGTISLNVIVD